MNFGLKTLSQCPRPSGNALRFLRQVDCEQDAPIVAHGCCSPPDFRATIQQLVRIAQQRFRGGHLSWIWIVVGLIIAFGPLFWMMPSRRERTLMRMRNRARALGILVELVEVDDPFASAEARVTTSGRVRTPKLSGVAYRLPFLRPLSLAPAWAIIRLQDGRAPSGARARE